MCASWCAGLSHQTTTQEPGNGKPNFFLLLQQICNDICQIQGGYTGSALPSLILQHVARLQCAQTFFARSQAQGCKIPPALPIQAPWLCSGGWCRRDTIPYAVKGAWIRGRINGAFLKNTQGNRMTYSIRGMVPGLLKIQELLKLWV